MKHRKPEGEPPAWTAPTAEARGWREFQVTTITPIYGGGVIAGESDPELPVRAAAIRGQLRFWWRLLNRERYGRQQRLFTEERKIWGGMSEDNKDWSSTVQIRVTIGSGLQHKPFKNAADVGIPAYAIAVALTGRNSTSILAAGLGFTLSVKCPDPLWAEVEETLRWWASFGGLGARTRRGLGAIRINGLVPVSRAEAEAKGCSLVQKDTYPNAQLAWQEVIKALQNFRQGEGIARRQRGAGAKVPGRSFWPEPDSIREITGRHRQKADGFEFVPEHAARIAFPRACFGLPILFHFKNIKHDKPGNNERGDLHFDPADTTLVPADNGIERMASPLILKPLALADGRYAACALALPHDHLRDLALILRQGDRRLRTLPAGDWWPTNEAAAARKCAEIKPLQGRDATDPLTAFLDFFEKGR